MVRFNPSRIGGAPNPFAAPIVMVDAVNFTFGTATGTKFGTATTEKLGFWNVTPIVQPVTYTQTYSTAARTHSTPTATVALTDNTAGTADTTLEVIAGAVYTTDIPAIRNNFADLAANDNKLRADHLILAGLVNSLINDHKAMGLCA